MSSVIARIKGGLGNQLFCYAAARRLALANDAELVIDHVTGFVRDSQYSRAYQLNAFRLPARMATPAERLEPFERYRRALLKWASRGNRIGSWRYVEQKGVDFEPRILSLRLEPGEKLYLDGLWQSEGYFKDIEPTIRSDLQVPEPTDEQSQRVAQQIARARSVAVHVRWFTPPGVFPSHNVEPDYYARAVARIEADVHRPHYFLFSDDPKAALESLPLPRDRVTAVPNNGQSDSALVDLWLMTRCEHFITANSTFSWWGAWLGRQTNSIIVTPRLQLAGTAAWGFAGLVPPEWIEL